MANEGSTTKETGMVAWLRSKVLQAAREQKETGRALVEGERELIKRWIRATWGRRELDSNMVSLLMGRFADLWEQVGAEDPVGADAFAWLQAQADASPAGAEQSWPLADQTADRPRIADDTRTMQAVRQVVKLVKTVAAEKAEPVPVG